MDAVRICDGTFVVMKVFDKTRFPDELKIATYFSSPELAHDPHNHCVHILDFFDLPNEPNKAIIVMPLLKSFHDPPFETVGEVVDCVGQLIEVCTISSSVIYQLSLMKQGLKYMHDHNIAHRYVWPY